MKAFLKKLGFVSPDPAAMALYATAVLAAREETYYTACGVPDTLDGRFDMVSLCVSLVNARISRMASEHPERARDLIQELFDVMFADMDINLREMGVSDEGMKYRIKPMASAHAGRVVAYGEAVSVQDDTERLKRLGEVVKRNIFRNCEDKSGADSVARRAFALSRQLDEASDDDIWSGRFEFKAVAHAPATGGGDS
ncbi:MAG: ubiquinol-cytochrome C chaperone [Alphaproteobacteria bacterium]|nr:ubiquinol-cytochrome C chaperone [Alphaproteobacteria bacterium]MBF0249059.1 ubiquinol-cytochrome C chaperone [Alphaproteobacteria bacterium]